MKAKEIAENLRKSRRPWIKGRLYRPGKGYCVLGIKAVEHGVSRSLLGSLNLDVDYGGVDDLFMLNDNCSSKQELIGRLLEEPNRVFPVERFIKRLLALQKSVQKRKENSKQKEATQK